MLAVQKKLIYYLQIFPLIKYVKNWWKIMEIYFHPNKPVVLDLRSGSQFKINHHLDALTIKEIFIDQDYRPKLKDPKVIIDVGANIGTFSILAALKYPHSKIYSFEPADRTNSLLNTNVKLNNITNITTIKKGVSSSVGKASFFTHPATGLSSLTRSRPGMRQINILLTSLPEVFSQFSIKKCDFLKMDCEGAEYDILFSLPNNFFKKLPYIILEYHDSINKHRHSELVTFLKQHNYKIKISSHPLESDIGIIEAKLTQNKTSPR